MRGGVPVPSKTLRKWRVRRRGGEMEILRRAGCCVMLLSAVKQLSVASLSLLHKGPIPASPLSEEFIK